MGSKTRSENCESLQKVTLEHLGDGSKLEMTHPPPLFEGRDVSKDEHVMRDLDAYITPKVHCDIRQRQWSRIIVKGHYDRYSSRPTDNEKQHKSFNWHRPTTTWLDNDTLQLNCFPGVDYVEHYASIVATYLGLHNKTQAKVLYERPGQNDGLKIFHQSNLRKMGTADMVVIGYVHQLKRFIGSKWETGDMEDIPLFKWQRLKTPHGGSVVALGCMVSCWGDIAGQLITALKELNAVKEILYLGKAGSLRPGDPPNECIATGHMCCLNGCTLRWEPFCRLFPPFPKRLYEGNHVTVSSPLFESKEWLKRNQAQNFDWVDCEVGNMAKAIIDLKISFTYFCIVSDNVARHYDYDLSNEHLPAVKLARQSLFHELEDIIVDLFNRRK